ncbi:MAG TPA: serine hydrolase domain-containing protein [Terriglobales bacterium]|nr:serine hydrolase domain-containing protein [Terriglobales bacterium]
MIAFRTWVLSAIESSGGKRGSTPLTTSNTTTAFQRSLKSQRSNFSPAFEVLEQAIADGAFPGASFAVTHRAQFVAMDGVGRFTYQPESPPVKPETIWDLASVTKAVATTSAAMLFFQRSLLDLDLPLVEIARNFDTGDPRRRQVTIRMLLTHNSGLPAYERLFKTAHRREELIKAAFTLPLVTDPGTRTEYSDIGFIILGVLLEQITGEPLDRFCRREIFDLLGMKQTTFNPPTEWRTQIPPTYDDREFRHGIVQGEVQDENAWVMGGVAGHAGLFSSAGDLALFANCILQGGAPILERHTVDLFCQRQLGSARALGWDTPTPPSQAGRYFSPNSIGHLGYAGSSLWIDRDRQLAVVLLTNRTWPDRSLQKIKYVRPIFHDAIVRSLGIDVPTDHS